MSRDEVQKLLGGYATGTLTPEERAALFEAALDDQDLFDQLAKEQPLADLLGDSTVRAQLLAALDERPVPWYKRWASWGVPALATALLVAGVAVWRVTQTASRPVEVAKVEAPAPVLAPQSEPAVATQAPPKTEEVRRQAQPANAPLRSFKKEPAADAAPVPVTPAPGTAPAAPPPPPPVPAAKAPVAMTGAIAGAVPPAAVSGNVKDASGAAVAGADVKFIPSGATAPVLTTQTAANGNFVAPLTAGDYRVEVNAPGFQPFRRDDVVINGASPTQLPVTLQVGASAETVQVTAAAPTPQQFQQSAGQPFAGGQLDRLAQAKTSGAFMAELRAPLISRVLRKNADGSLTPVTADDLRAGETIVIQFTPTTAGFLTVTETPGASIVSGAAVQADRVFETPPIALDKTGPVVFSANVSATPPASGGGGGGGPAKRAAVSRPPAPQSTTIRITVH